jgi:hypothetical protein
MIKLQETVINTLAAYAIIGLQQAKGIDEESAKLTVTTLVETLKSLLMPPVRISWRDEKVKRVYPNCSQQFRDYTWTEMGQGSWMGGRHHILRWIARGGRTSFDKPKSISRVPYGAVLCATQILREVYGEDLGND